jgi:two-component system chemotaxis response regulator CheB
MPTDPDPPLVVGLAASAGGVETLRTVIGALPADFPGALLVVLHIPPTGRSLLAPILDRAGALPVDVARAGARLERGTVYVAPADRHLLVRRRTIRLSDGPKENGARPAADPLFRSLAETWGTRAVAIVLSGALDDGSAGVIAVKRAGGTVIVQDPRDAVASGMPESALAATTPDHVVPAGEIAGLLVRLAQQPDALQATPG